MDKPAEIESSVQMNSAQEIKAQNRKETIKKIRDNLKRAAARNKSRLSRKTSVVRRLQKSSLLKSHPSFEASLYERTLLYNNRKLAHALQNLRQENRLLQDQILDLTHRVLDYDLKQADSNRQLANLQQCHNQKQKKIENLRKKLVELTEMVSELQNDDFPDAADQVVAFSGNEDEPSAAGNRRRSQRMSNPFDLSVILEVPDKSLNHSGSQSYQDSRKASDIPAILSKIGMGKLRRETFVVHASRQISDLPSPVRNARQRTRIRRSDDPAPVLRLSETPEKPVVEKEIESTITFPVDMEMTSVLQTPITGFCVDGGVPCYATETTLSNTLIDDIGVSQSSIKNDFLEEANNHVAVKDGTVVSPTLIFTDNTNSSSDGTLLTTIIENNPCANRNTEAFSFVTERLSSKMEKRSAALVQSSSEFAVFGECSNAIREPEELMNISSNALSGFPENENLVPIPEKAVATQHASSSQENGACQKIVTAAKKSIRSSMKKAKKMESIDARDEHHPDVFSPIVHVDANNKNELMCKQKRVSFSGMPSPPVKKSKSKSRRNTALNELAINYDKDEVPYVNSPTKDLGNSACSKSSGKPIHHTDLPERSVLGDVSPNRMTQKRFESFSPKVGKPFVKLSTISPKGEEVDFQPDNAPINRTGRARKPVNYKEPSVHKKMRRE